MNRIFDRSGEIREVDLLAAVVALWREKSSVTLDFTRAAVSSGFDVADGEVVASFSADPRFETASILVRANKLDAAALERLAVPEGSDRAMAAMQAGVLTRREWKWGEKIRAIEVLSDLLTWSDGRYLVEPDTRSVAGEFRLPIPRLLLELFLRSRDRGLVEHQLGNPDVALARLEDFDAEFSTFGLTADAESVVRLLDGKSTAREIAAKAPADAFAVEKLLAALITLGLVRPGDSPAQAPEPQAAALPAPEPPSPAAAAAEPERFATDDFQAGESLDAQLERPAESEITPTERFPEIQPPSTAASSEPDIEPRGDAPFGAPGLGAADAFETQSLDAVGVEPELPEAPAPSWDTTAGPPDPVLERTEEPILTAPRRGQGPILALIFALLAAAVVGVLVFRSCASGPPAEGPEQKPPPPAPTAVPRPSEVPVAVVPAPASPNMAAAKAVKPSPTSKSAPAATSRPAPTSKPTLTGRPAAVPTKAVPTGAPPVAAGPDRKIWLDRAEASRKRFAAEPSTKYSIQLLLACEVPTLQDAFSEDRPAGSMWLLATDHGGRVCFRVLWGRFATLEEARKARDGVPRHFVTAANRPAVVAVR